MEIEKTLKQSLTDARPHKALVKIQHKRAFGLAVLACASFVLVLSFVLPAVDRVFWIGCGLSTLAVGGFLFDQASRELKKLM